MNRKGNFERTTCNETLKGKHWKGNLKGLLHEKKDITANWGHGFCSSLSYLRGRRQSGRINLTTILETVVRAVETNKPANEHKYLFSLWSKAIRWKNLRGRSVDAWPCGRCDGSNGQTYGRTDGRANIWGRLVKYHVNFAKKNKTKKILIKYVMIVVNHSTFTLKKKNASFHFNWWFKTSAYQTVKWNIILETISLQKFYVKKTLKNCKHLLFIIYFLLDFSFFLPCLPFLVYSVI